MHKQLRSLLLLFLVLPFLVSCSRRPVKPSILLITLDTTRQDHLGCYGYDKAMTPTLDRLAAKGLQFDTCVSVVPLTLPAHTSILSGLLPPEHGLHVNGQGSLSSDIPLLQVFLKKEGYRTGAVIAAAVVESTYGLSRGFDHYDETLPPEKRLDPNMPGGIYHTTTPASRPGNEVTDAALAWIHGLEGDQPTFLWAHFYDPHDPYDDMSATLGHSFDSAYDSEIAFMDREVGRLIDGARKAFGRNLVIIAVGDHGESLGEHGERGHGLTLYRGTSRVPLLISGPGIHKARVTRPVSQVDIVPTVLELVGRDATSYLEAFRGGPEVLSGHSLLGNGPEKRSCYLETMMPFTDYKWAPLHGVCDGEWKFIRGSATELYDIGNDPYEKADLSQEFDDITAEHLATLDAIERGTYRGVASQIALSPEDRRRLESLGYAAGATPMVGGSYTGTQWSALADIREMLPLVDKASRVREELTHSKPTGETLAICRELVATSPQTPRFHAYLAGCLGRMGKTDEALEVYRQAVEKFPKEAFLASSLGRTLLGSGRTEEARAALEQAVRLAPHAPQALAALGVVYLKENRPEAALKHLEASVALDGTSHGAHKYLGDAYAAVGSNTLAIAQYRKALELNPHWPDALAPLTDQLLVRKADDDVREALPLAWALCEESAHRDPHYLLLLARAYQAAGRPEKASETVQVALPLASDDPDLIEHLTALAP